MEHERDGSFIGGGCYPSAEMQSVYSAASFDWASLGKSYPSAEMQSVYSIAPQEMVTHWVGLTFCRDVIGVFRNPS